MFKVANTSSLKQHQENYTYNLNGLKYANSLYDVRVYMRSPMAVGEDKWSQSTNSTFKTQATSKYSGAGDRSHIVEVLTCQEKSHQP